MSTPIGLPAIGTILAYGNGMSPETYTTISNDSSITGLGMSAAIVDVTSHSQGNPWRQKIPTLLDSGDVVFDLFIIPADTGHQAIINLFTTRGLNTAGTPIPFRLTYPAPDNSVILFQGFITKMNFSAAVADVVKAQITITTTGIPILP